MLALSGPTACADPELTDVLVVLDADEVTKARARELTVRVTDTDGILVLDRTAPVASGSWPARVPLAPRDGLAARTFSLEASLADDACDFAEVRVSSGYVDRREIDLPVRFDDSCIDVACAAGETCSLGECVTACVTLGDEPAVRTECGTRSPPSPCDPSNPRCTEPQVFVDAETGVDAPDACLDPGSPCRTLAYAVEEYMATRRSRVLNARGGQTHGAFRLDARASGSAALPTFVRSWPGTGRARVDPAGAEPGGCLCGETDADADPAFVVVEELEFTGSESIGLELEGTDLLVRGCHFHDLCVDGSFGSALLFDYGARNRVAGNVFRAIGTRSSDACAAVRIGGGADHLVESNLIEDVYSYPIFTNLGATFTIRENRIRGAPSDRALWLSGESGVVEHNEICGGTTGAIVIDGLTRAEVHHNSVFRSHVGIRCVNAPDATLTANLVSGSEAAGIAVEAGAVDARGNFLFQNGMPSMEIVGTLRSDEANTIGVDPRFADTSACDLRTRLCSPARASARGAGVLRVPE